MVTGIQEQRKIGSAVAFLRAAGHSDEADSVAALFLANEPEDGAVTMDDAATLLGTTSIGIVRRVERGVLDGADLPDGRGGVRIGSLLRQVETKRALLAAMSLPGEPPETDPDSLLMRILEDARERYG